MHVGQWGSTLRQWGICCRCRVLWERETPPPHTHTCFLFHWWSLPQGHIFVFEYKLSTAMEWSIGLSEERGHVHHVGCGLLLISEIWAKKPPLASKGLKGEYVHDPAGPLCSWESSEENKQQLEAKRAADRHNESIQGGTDHTLQRLEPCGKLGKWGCHPSQFSL